MATLTIKGIPEELYARLKEAAAAHRRSINSEVIVRIERSLGSRKIDPKEFLLRVDELREHLALPPIDDTILRTAKETGRP